MPDLVRDMFNNLKEQISYSEINLYQNGHANYLINLKSRESVYEIVREHLHRNAYSPLIWEIKPVMPILSGADGDLPFSTIDQMLELSDEKNLDLADLAVRYECVRAGIDTQKVFSFMHDIVTTIKNSIKEGLNGTRYEDRILGHQSHLIGDAQKTKRILSTPHNRIIAYVTAIMEAKSSMGVIVAAPTAGSAGVLGGAVFAVAEELSAGTDSIIKAFLAAGLIGVFIAHKYTFAAEEGGCQVECGAASAMAAAGLVQLMGGTARQATNASSMALGNLLGLVCDPVADRVEVPCLGKNILGATNALNSANMSISGFDPVIPFDEVIDAMKSVGENLPSSLCCTGLGGLSVTPTSLKLYEELKIKRADHKNAK